MYYEKDSDTRKKKFAVVHINVVNTVEISSNIEYCVAILLTFVVSTFSNPTIFQNE